MPVKSLFTSLAQIVALLNKSNINWFVNGGCCLGYVRDKNLIPHDIDVDIGIYDTERSVESFLAELPVSKIRYFRNRISEVTVNLDCPVDIFILFKYDDKIVETIHGERINEVRLLGYEQSIIESGVTTQQLAGLTVNMLREAERYCSTIYGPEYMTPDPRWNSWSDPFNIVHTEYILSEKIIRERFCGTSSKHDMLNGRIAWLRNIFMFSIDARYLPIRDLAGLVFFFYQQAHHEQNGEDKYHADHLVNEFSRRVLRDIIMFEFRMVATCAIVLLDLIEEGLIGGDIKPLIRQVDFLAQHHLKNKENVSAILDIAWYFLRRSASRHKLPINRSRSILRFLLASYMPSKPGSMAGPQRFKHIYLLHHLSLRSGENYSSEISAGLLNLLLQTQPKHFVADDLHFVKELENVLWTLCALCVVDVGKFLNCEQDYWWISDHFFHTAGGVLRNTKVALKQMKRISVLTHLCQFLIEHASRPGIGDLKDALLDLIGALQESLELRNIYVRYNGCHDMNLHEGMIGYSLSLQTEYPERLTNSTVFFLLTADESTS